MSAIHHSVFEATVRVAGEALYWKRSLKRILRTSGVTEKVVTQYEDLTKYQILREVWARLDNAGSRGLKVQKNIVAHLANLDAPEEKADQRAGKEAIAELQRLSKAYGLLVDPDQLTRKRAQEERQRKADEKSRREMELGRLLQRFRDLHDEQDARARGYEFERMLADLFRLYEIEFKGSYKTEIDQVDGALKFDSFTYLLEARWRKEAAVEADLSLLHSKVARRIDATRGIFISMMGFRSEVVDLYRLSRGQKLVFIDGQDLAFILEDRVELPDALRAKISAASIDGEPYLQLSSLI